MLELLNPIRPEIQSIQAEATIAGGAYVRVPETVGRQLQLRQLDVRSVALADGSSRLLPYVGPLEIRFKNRVGYCGAVIMGDKVLMGTMLLDEMDLVRLPSDRIEINPLHPDFAAVRV